MVLARGQPQDTLFLEPLLITAKAMGIRNLIIAVHNMDTLLSYSQETFNSIELHVRKSAESVSFSKEKMVFIPIDCTQDDNVTKNSPNTPYYNGPTVLEAIENFDPIQHKYTDRDQPGIAIVNAVDKIGGIGTVVECTVVSGTFKPGKFYHLSPKFTAKDPAVVSSNWKHKRNSPYNSDQISSLRECRSIEHFYQPVNEASRGMQAAFSLKGTSVKDVHKGQLITEIPFQPIQQFRAVIVIVKCWKKGFRVGYTPLLICHAERAPCKLTKIYSTEDKKTGTSLGSETTVLTANTKARVQFLASRPVW